MGNNDIFDEEDLLAIANDGGDSSSCGSSNASDEEGDSPPGVPVKAEEPSLAAENPSASGDGGHDGAKPECPSLPSSEEEPKQPSSAQKPEAVGGEDASSSSSDGGSDDGGFLESWVKEANSKAAAKSALANSNQEESGHDDWDEPAYTDGGEEHGAPNSGKTRVELGASVLQWISREESGGKGKADRATGVVGIQQTTALSPILRLTTSEISLRKRRRGGDESAKATIEDISEQTASDRRVQSGRVVHASDATRSSNSGNMVDCLARYDSAKRCYVLEMVGMRIDNLQPMGEEAQTIAGTDTCARSKRESSTQSTERFDPRSIAKRAEEQVKQLKRGKGRAEAPKRRKQI
ncbi:hypothetical protein ACHAXT_005372 [Thalassiosira profunda]